MRSSWLASATNARTLSSEACRAASEVSTCPSIRLTAAPTRPASVRSSVSRAGTRSEISASPRSSGKLGDALRRGSDAVERAQRTAHDGGRDERSEHHGGGADQYLDEDVALERGGRVGPRQGGHDDVSGCVARPRALSGQGAVAAEPRHVDPDRGVRDAEQRVGLRIGEVDDGAGLVEVAGADDLAVAHLDDDRARGLAEHGQTGWDSAEVRKVRGGRHARSVGAVRAVRPVGLVRARLVAATVPVAAVAAGTAASAFAGREKLCVDPFQERGAQREGRDEA